MVTLHHEFHKDQRVHVCFGWFAPGQDGIVATIPQYNSATCEYTSCNIKLFCGNLSIMSKSSVSALDALQLMAEYQIKENVARGREPSDCTDASYQKYVDGMKSAKALLKLKAFLVNLLYILFFCFKFDNSLTITLVNSHIKARQPTPSCWVLGLTKVL